MTSTLRGPDLRAVLGYAETTLAVEDFAQVQQVLLGELADLVGCDAVTLTHLDLRTRREVAVFWPPSRPTLATIERYSRVADQHPLRPAIAERMRTGRLDAPPVRISDVLSPREWRRSPVRTEAMPDIADQMCLPLAASGSAVHVVGLARTGGTFTVRQRDMLGGSRRHLAAALRRARRRDRPALQIAPSLAWVTAADAPGVPDGVADGVELPTLSRREREVLALVATGSTDAQVARQLQLSPATVSRHLHRIYRRLQVPNRTAAVQRWSHLEGPSRPGHPAPHPLR